MFHHISIGQHCFNTQQWSCFSAIVAGKKSNKNNISQQETLLRKCQTWRCQSTALYDTPTAHAMCTVCYEKQGISPGSNLFQPHCSPIRSSNKTTAQAECPCMRAHIHTGQSVMTFTCTLDLTWHLQHQGMALLQLMLYRAEEAQTQFSLFLETLKGMWVLHTTNT